MGAPRRVVGWPMYAVDPGAVAAFWRGLRARLNDAGLGDVPDSLAAPDDLAAHWRDPGLLLSHTCGYPLVTQLGSHVRYVATPRFRAPGCTGAFYSSAVMVRDDDPATDIVGLRGRRVAFNGRDSQSGYNALRALVAPKAVAGRFFGAAIETGGHRRSLAALRAGDADVAAIDAVTLALTSIAHPDEIRGLRALCHTAAAPGLPFITAGAATNEDVGRLRSALAAACAPDEPAAQALLLDGTEVLPPAAYDVIHAMEAAARDFGYPDLN